VDRVPVIRVPGSFELPLAAKRYAERHADTDAVIALGVVIRGETAHFDFVAAEAARGIAEVARSTGRAVAFGVLTTNTTEQAMARSGGAAGNRGFDAMESAIKMANLHKELDGAGSPAAERVER
jgi:6,7-dimethyl-8-ribityllumazine synthase